MDVRGLTRHDRHGVAECDTVDETYLGCNTRHSISVLLSPCSALDHILGHGECRRSIGKELV
jgi:hypothetical protein